MPGEKNASYYHEVVLSIYNMLKDKYAHLHFESLWESHGHYLIFSTQESEDNVYRFKIEIATNPIRIGKHEIKIMSLTTGEKTEIREHELYSQIISDARKIAKGKPIK